MNSTHNFANQTKWLMSIKEKYNIKKALDALNTMKNCGNVSIFDLVSGYN